METHIDYLTLTEAAEMLGMSRGGLYFWIVTRRALPYRFDAEEDRLCIDRRAVERVLPAVASRGTRAVLSDLAQPIH